MIAQLSPSAPFGSPSSSSIGVRCTRVLLEVLGARRLAPDVQLLEVEPAARTKTRAVMLFTLGLRMFSVLSAMSFLLGS